MLDPNIFRILSKKYAFRKLINYLIVEFQAGRRDAHAFGKPYWLTIDPTNFCQLRCPFCPTGMDRNVRTKAMMRFPEFKKILDDLGPTLLHIDFMNWGEPLLNKEVYDMIAYAKKFDIDTNMSTNLNSFSPDEAQKLVASGLDCLVLSIDGLTQETYGKYRVRGDYAKVLEHLKMIVEARRKAGGFKPYIVWQFLVFKHNEHEIEQVKEFGKSCGVDVVGITPAYMPFKPGIRENWIPTKPEYRMYDPATFPDSPPWQWESSAPSAEQDPSASVPAPSPADASPPETAPTAAPPPDIPWERILKAVRKFKKRLTASGDDAVPDVKVDVYKDSDQRKVCLWPWAGISVNPNGSVSPCCSVEEEEYDFGFYDKQSFRRLWNNPRYKEARRHIRRYVDGQIDVKARSAHACERCFSIGKSNFTFPAWWRFTQFDWWWGFSDAPPPASPDKQNTEKR